MFITYDTPLTINTLKLQFIISKQVIVCQWYNSNNICDK